MKGTERTVGDDSKGLEPGHPETIGHDKMLVFGPVVVDPVTDRLMIGGQERQLAPTPLRILKYLLLRPGTAVGRRELEREVLRTNHTQRSSSVRNHIAELRTALGSAASLVRIGADGWSLSIDASTVAKK